MDVRKHIISCRIGGIIHYILNAPLNPLNKRIPSYTTDVEKARRFYDDREAKTFSSQVLKKPGVEFTIETFEPAAL